MSSAAKWPSPSDARLRRIEQALVAVVCERGFASTTVEGVCGPTGAEVEAHRSHCTDLEHGYRALFVQGRYRFIAKDETRGCLLFVEDFSTGEPTQLGWDQGMAGMFELIDLGRNEFSDPESISPATAEGVGGGILAQIRAAVERDEPDAFRLKIPQLMYNVVRPCVGEEEARSELTLPPPGPPSAAAAGLPRSDPETAT